MVYRHLHTERKDPDPTRSDRFGDRSLAGFVIVLVVLVMVLVITVP